MRYLLSVIDDHTGLANASEEAAIDVINDRLGVAGHWVFAAGLGAPDTATVIDRPEGRGAAAPGRLTVRDVGAAITQAHHEEWARVVATLARRSGALR